MFRYGGAVGPKPSKAASKTVPLRRNHQQQKPHSSKTSKNAAPVEDTCTDISDIDAVFHHPKPAVKSTVAPKRLKMMNKMNPVVGNATTVSAVAANSNHIGNEGDLPEQAITAGGGEHQKFSTNPVGISEEKTKVDAESRLKKPYVDRSLQPMISSELDDATDDGDNEKKSFLKHNNVNPSISSSPTSLTSNATGRKFSDRLRIAQKQPGLTKSKHQRVFVTHNYTDYMDEKPTADEIHWVCCELKKPIKRQSFLVKLYNALMECERDNMNHVFYWLPHGRAFIIDDLKQFEEIVLPKYLKMDRYTSFLKQCHLYNFQRLTRGSGDESSGSRYHPYFLKGKLFLCRRVKRTKVKGHNIRPAAVFGSEPNLFALKPCVDSENENRMVERWMDWVHSDVRTVEYFLHQEEAARTSMTMTIKTKEGWKKSCEEVKKDENETKNAIVIVDTTSQTPHHDLPKQGEAAKQIKPPNQDTMTTTNQTYYGATPDQVSASNQQQMIITTTTNHPQQQAQRTTSPSKQPQPQQQQNSSNHASIKPFSLEEYQQIKPNFIVNAQPQLSDSNVPQQKSNQTQNPQDSNANPNSNSNQVIIQQQHRQQPQPQQNQIAQQIQAQAPSSGNGIMIQQQAQQRVQYITQQPQPQPQRIQIIQQAPPPPQFITTTTAGQPQFRIVQQPQQPQQPQFITVQQQASPQFITVPTTTSSNNGAVLNGIGMPQQQQPQPQQVILQVVQTAAPQQQFMVQQPTQQSQPNYVGQQQMIRTAPVQFTTSNLNAPFVTTTFPAPTSSSSSSNAPMQMQMNNGMVAHHAPMQMQMQQIQTISAPAPVGGGANSQQQMIAANQNHQAAPNNHNTVSVPQMQMQMQQNSNDGVNSAAVEASGSNSNHTANGNGDLVVASSPRIEIETTTRFIDMNIVQS